MPVIKPALMSQKTDPKAAYAAGVLDGFHLARTETMSEAEDLIAEINRGDVEARIRVARTGNYPPVGDRQHRRDKFARPTYQAHQSPSGCRCTTRVRLLIEFNEHIDL